MQLLIVLLGIVAFLTIYALSMSTIVLSTEEIILFAAFIILMCIGLSVAAVYAIQYVKRKRYENVTLHSVDAMTGVEFEEFVAYLYELQGYRVERTPVSGDLGVDLIAIKNGERIAIQVKRYTGSVGRSAVSDAVAGMAQYRCTSSIVVTNSYYTPLAKKLAYSNRCVLIDRMALSTMIGSVKH